MTHYNQNASVIYTDSQGNQIDTFVIFDTDPTTGLTQINHENLKVPAHKLRLHAKTVCQYHLPIDDAFSFEIIMKLREKYQLLDERKAAHEVTEVSAKEVGSKYALLAKAS